jgi:hypothetical protein
MCGYNPHRAVRYSPLPFPLRGSPHIGRIRRPGPRHATTRHGHESPWAKLFAQGAMKTIVYDQ